MRALALAPLSPWAREALGGRLELVYEPWTETRRLWDPAELAARLAKDKVHVVVTEADFLFGEVFEGDNPLRMVALCRAATNHVDLEAATQRGVLVVNSPGRNAQGVAELALGLMLALARRIPQLHSYVTGGRWQDPVEPYISLRGVELAGKTLGVVGLGAIGRRVARLGRALGMKVLAYDPYVAPPRGILGVDLDALLRQSDFVTLHAPETPQTRGMLNAPALALMKPGAYLINTAGAALVEAEALAEALQSGRLSGAAFDVFETAPLPPTSPLLKLNNVVLTPHIGGATDGTGERYSRMVAEDILRFLDGKRPRRLVNPEAWRGRRG
ncbi:MAG: 3-phosphoglycerate dehydrogenase [Chloroflexi bacterium]|nr:3-phosphoglycerate dehydrogenase [Chloroflexota bacterium]